LHWNCCQYSVYGCVPKLECIVVHTGSLSTLQCNYKSASLSKLPYQLFLEYIALSLPPSTQQRGSRADHEVCLFTFNIYRVYIVFKSRDINEYILFRILLERLIAKKPHPFGLSMTFSELTKNKDYKFWSYDFAHCSPALENWLKQNNYY
jgi:hypothetical protein